MTEIVADLRVVDRYGERLLIMRYIRPAMILAVTGAATLAGLVGTGSAGAGAIQPDAAGGAVSLVGAGNAAAVQQGAGQAAQPVPSCYRFWRASGHTNRVRWYHCHSTGDPYVARVHICGFSGTLHGVSVASLPGGVWLRGSHRHDPGGEGC